MSTNVVFTPEYLEQVVERCGNEGAFVFDVEAWGPNRGVPIKAQLCWMGLATTGLAVAVPFGHPNGYSEIAKATRRKNKATGKFDPIPAKFSPPPEQMSPSQVFEILRPLFFNPDVVKVAHNFTYDGISTAKYFGEIVIPEYSDTIVLQWLLDENIKQKGLKELVKRYYGVDYDKENVGRFIEGYTFGKVAHYTYMDAKYEWLLYQKLRKQITDQGLEGVYALEMDVLGVLLEVGIEGAPVDVQALRALEVTLSERLVDIEAWVYKSAGRIFNINSTQQKANLLYGSKPHGGQGIKPFKPTDGGRKKKEAGMALDPTDYSTDADSLEMHPKNLLAKTLLEYQEVNKLLGTYVRGYLGVEGDPDKPCQIFDGRIHAEFVQYGTVTGRFSCRAPNLQNIPTPASELGKQIRGLWVAPPGDSLLVADYGQIELVVLAHYLGVGALFEGFFNGIDPHTMTAAGVLNKDPKDVTPTERNLYGKSINFAVVYGAGAAKVAAMSESSERQAKKFLAEHERQFPEIYAFKDAVIERAKTRRPPYIQTLLGRKRRLPTLFSSDRGLRSYAERQAVNSLIQGSSADLIKLAMVRLNNIAPDWLRLILTVHDELVALIPEDRAEEAIEIMTEAMLGEGITSLVRVPMKSDIKVVKRWSEAK